MCIRDSGESVGIQLPSYKLKVVDDDGKEVASGSVGELWVCLLYTSDAADDLLCVALGGRRIIKNKIK